MRSNVNVSCRIRTHQFVIGLAACALAACRSIWGTVPPPAPRPIATDTPVPATALLPSPTTTPSPSPTASPTARPCMLLLAPSHNAELPAYGKVIFSWDEVQGASGYQLSILQPDGSLLRRDTATASIPCYMESYPADGIYLWHISALDDGGETICSSTISSFRKGRLDRPSSFREESLDRPSRQGGT